MKATFEKTVDILVKAYLNGTLLHGNCYACAVGNIIAASTGRQYRKIKSKKDWETLAYNGEPSLYEVGKSCKELELWPSVFSCISSDKINYHHITDKLQNEFNSTGYTVEELFQIETAFEKAENRGYISWDQDTPYNNDQWMFNGLMAVVDVLAEIHNIDLKQKDEAKALFVKA